MGRREDATAPERLEGSGQGKGGETVWLCKICGEEKEMWRKSGAWFFKVNKKALENKIPRNRW